MPPDILKPYGIGVGFAGFNASTPAIPQMYWDVYSAEQRWKEICCNLKKLIEYADSMNIELGITKDRVSKLEADFQKFMESGFFDYYQKQLEEWFLANAWQLYERQAKQVFFGLTDDGYFCAYVPDSWKEITFDTGAVFGRSDYGRLCLKYDATGHGVVDNTYSYSLNNWQSVSSEVKKMLVQLAADLETNSKRTDSVFNTLYTNIEQELGRDGENE